MELEEPFRRFAAFAALVVEAGAVLLILVGAAEALIQLFRPRIRREPELPFHGHGVWQRFARWLILALEFEVAADIVRTAVSPSWDQIGQLGAIAFIRTGLNYFLQRDVEHAAAMQRAQLPESPPASAALEASTASEHTRRDAHEARPRGEHAPA